jgi:hypothetical protein
MLNEVKSAKAAWWSFRTPDFSSAITSGGLKMTPII